MHDDDHDLRAAPASPRLLGLRRRDLLVLFASMLLLTLTLWLMNLWIFPYGTGLGDGQATQAASDGRDDGSRRGFSVYGADDADSLVARLAEVERSVKLRVANEVVWSGADQGAALRNQDAVQTLARSRAVIAFNSSSTIELGESSLIVIQSGGRDAFVPRRRAALRLESGEVAGTHLADADGEALADDLDLELPFGRLRVFGADAARFRIRTNPDATSTVEIFSGEAELQAAGQLVRLEANQGVTFGADSVDLIVQQLPAAPLALGPAHASVLRYADVPPRVRFRWRGGDDEAQYRFVLARNAQFTDVLADTRVGTTSLDYDNLEGGEYFWTVRALRGWQESPAAPVRRVVLEHDQSPPRLQLQGDALETLSGRVIVRGRSEAGARVVIDGQTAQTAADGSFAHELDVPPGASLIVVEAIDDVGNIAFSSLVVRNAATFSAGDLP